MNEIERAIDRLKSKMDGNTDTSYEWCETVRTAIQALQEKTERGKGCTYCNEKTCENCGQGNQSYCDNCKHQKSWCDREVSFKYWVSLHNYCPHCGRKLGENNG